MRDLTRGGLATALVELTGPGVSIRIDEAEVPVNGKVKSACEVFGLDPLYVANEGRFILVVAPEQAAPTLDLLRSHAETREAVPIGTVSVSPNETGLVVMRARYGTNRIIDMLSGEQLPRIC